MPIVSKPGMLPENRRPAIAVPSSTSATVPTCSSGGNLRLTIASSARLIHVNCISSRMAMEAGTACTHL